MSCQRFCWQLFIYQAATFPRTRQSCRYEGQQESRILIKDQAAKNKTGPAGASPRRGGVRGGAGSSRINYHAPTRSWLFRVNVSRTVSQLQEPLEMRMESQRAGAPDRGPDARRKWTPRGQRWTETTGTKHARPLPWIGYIVLWGPPGGP